MTQAPTSGATVAEHTRQRLFEASRAMPTLFSVRVGESGHRMFWSLREVAMRGLQALGAVSKWLFSTALRVVGIESHGVDPKGADYSFKPPPPEYRP